MRVAIYHNLVSGGNKRMIYETVRGMKANGHTVDVFMLSISNENFFPLAPLADRVTTQQVFSPRASVRLHPGLRQLIHLPSVWRANRAIAEAINQNEYDVVWVTNCWVSQHPIILRYLKWPHLLYTGDHFRGAYDRIAARAMGYGARGGGRRPRVLDAVAKMLLAFLAVIDRTNVRA